MQIVDSNPRFKRDNRDDVLKQTEELIKRAKDVLEKLPDSDLKNEIAEKLTNMKQYKHELENAKNPIKITHFELELLTMFEHFQSLLDEANEIITITEPTTTTPEPTTQTPEPTTSTPKPATKTTKLTTTTTKPTTLNPLKQLIIEMNHYIKRGEHVLGKLPHGHLRHEIEHYVRRLSYLEKQLVTHHHNQEHVIYLAREIERNINEFKPWLEEAEDLTKENSTPNPTTTTIKPTTK